MNYIDDVPQVRACGLCIYARHATPAEHSTCWHPRVTIAVGPVPLAHARAIGGACGLEAIYMHVPGVIGDERSHSATHAGTVRPIAPRA